MMAYSKVAQKILENPIGNALENQKEFNRIDDCEIYLEDNNVTIYNSINFIQNNTYNTKARVRAYLDYNLALSGGVYGSSPSDWNADACDFDVESLIGGVK